MWVIVLKGRNQEDEVGTSWYKPGKIYLFELGSINARVSTTMHTIIILQWYYICFIEVLCYLVAVSMKTYIILIVEVIDATTITNLII